jgi:hypothetical protein
MMNFNDFESDDLVMSSKTPKKMGKKKSFQSTNQELVILDTSDFYPAQVIY